MAAVALVLGVIGVVGVPIFGPVAWLVAHRELAAIGAGRRPAGGRQVARAGRALGITATILLVAAVGLFALALLGVIEVD
jgi:hypothetical protein